ncbi:tRNA-intron endonuclease catalytic domain-like protein [Rhodocollybia butyracea]|uniref:tRNA-splicing endonuclease subunit Sen34 n=1 Tax=Rhodocollybia butyracea TaxID=206335 RepID=A0A9P5PUS8_9AGAR|nr:tRNA-intron endonuclease catalytic domain-like protein [Rhodocollybia butyracea]
MDSRKIPIRVANGRAYIWDVDDLQTIRSEHRLCGLLVGTLPHLSQQNLFLGIPSQLMPEEAALLVEKEYAVFVDDASAYRGATLSEFNAWNAEQREYIKHQQLVLEQEHANKKPPEVAQKVMSEEAIRKRKEREMKRQKKAAELQETEAEVPNANEEKVVEAEAPESSNAFPTTYNISIAAPSSSVPWYDPSNSTYSSISSAKAAGIWDFPSDLQDRARYGVFKDLWEQGYFMGGGIRFGGDYLVYPGDPLRYHSHFCATVISSPTQRIQPMEIVAHGRLGTATKKTHLFCTWDDEKGTVDYLSIEWAGFG